MRSKIGSGLYWFVVVVGLVVILSACGLRNRDGTETAGLVPGLVTMDTLQVVSLDTVPVQVQATVGGIINDNCTTVIGLNQQQQGNIFTLTPQTVVSDTGVCTAAQLPFTQMVALNVVNLPAGTYTVNAGLASQLFTLAVDNVAAADGGGGGGGTETGVAGETASGAQAGGQAAGSPVNQPTNGVFSMTNIYFIALEDGGQNGPAVGCNASIVPVTITLDPATPAVMTAAYTRLLGIKEQTYMNRNNPLYLSDLKLDSINIINREALVYLSGTWTVPPGDCSEAHMRAQLQYTALQYSTVNWVRIWLNNELLDPVGLG